MTKVLSLQVGKKKNLLITSCPELVLSLRLFASPATIDESNLCCNVIGMNRALLSPITLMFVSPELCHLRSDCCERSSAVGHNDYLNC